MKKFISLFLAVLMVFGLFTAVHAEKAPEEYAGTLTIYSPHDADPLNAGVAGFEAKYPNVTLDFYAATWLDIESKNHS